MQANCQLRTHTGCAQIASATERSTFMRVPELDTTHLHHLTSLQSCGVRRRLTLRIRATIIALSGTVIRTMLAGMLPPGSTIFAVGSERVRKSN